MRRAYVGTYDFGVYPLRVTGRLVFDVRPGGPPCVLLHEGEARKRDRGRELKRPAIAR